MMDTTRGVMQDISSFLPPRSDNGAAAKATALIEAATKAEAAGMVRGPVFSVGDVLEIKGGRFQITRIAPGHMRLKCVPASTFGS